MGAPRRGSAAPSLLSGAHCPRCCIPPSQQQQGGACGRALHLSGAQIHVRPWEHRNCHYNFVNVREEQGGTVTMREGSWRGKETERGNNINPVECKKLSHYLCALQEDTKIHWWLLFSPCHNNESASIFSLMMGSHFILYRPCSSENARKALDPMMYYYFQLQFKICKCTSARFDLRCILFTRERRSSVLVFIWEL